MTHSLKYHRVRTTNRNQTVPRSATRFAAVLLALTFAGTLPINANAGDNPHGHMFHHVEPDEPKLDYDSLWNLATPWEESSEGRQVLQDCLAAYGGKSHLETIRSLELSWKMKVVYVQDTVNVYRAAEFGRKHVIERKRGRGFERRILNGDEGWLQTADSVTPLPSARYKAELFSYLVMSMPLAAANEPFSEKRYGHRESDSLDYIYMKKNDTLLMCIGLDPVDHLVVKAEGIILEGDRHTVFINHFSEHTKWDNYLLPGKLISISMGLRVGESRLQHAKVNFEPDESTFMPKTEEGEFWVH